MIMTEEEKKQMPATRQTTSLLAVGCNLVLSEDKPEQAASVKRSGPCQASAQCTHAMSHASRSRSRRQTRPLRTCSSQGGYDGRGQPTAAPMLTAIMSGGVGISGRELYKYR